MSFADRVAAASAAWVYLPEGAPHVRTDEFVLVGYPLSWELPTQAYNIRSDRTPAELFAAAGEVARGWGRPDIAWWIQPATRPAALERALTDAGAVLAETVTVLGYDLSGNRPEPAPGNADARLVRTPEDARLFDRVNTAGWGAAPADEQQRADWLAELARGYARFVVTLDGRPASVGGATLAGDVLRLWGAVTLPEHRGRGAYRALLAARLSWGYERGARLALVKGRVQTSGPILRRAGFRPLGEERAYVLALS